MTNSKSTKRALMSGVLALVLCVSMLVGTTFAWFTDTASTNVNTIQAGTLDVALEMKEGNTWVSAEGKTLNFVAADGRSNILWEPGCTYELPELRIVNNGNLALKYKVVISGINGDAKLNEVIDWYYSIELSSVIPGASGWTQATDAYKLENFGDENYLYPAGVAANARTNEQVFKIIGKMRTSAGNAYQGLSIEGIAITVYATQYTYEKDSINDQYDSDAVYDIPWDGNEADNTNVPATSQDGKIHVSTAAELVSIMNTSQDENSAYLDKTIVLDNSINLGGHTVTGFGSDQCNFAGDFDGQGFTISNFTVDNNREWYNGLFNQLGPNGSVKNLTVENATVKGQRMVGVIASNVEGGAVVDNCHVYDSMVISTKKKAGAIAGYTSNGTVTNCTATDVTVYCADADEAESDKIVGYVSSGSTVENNTATNVTVARGVTPALVSTAAEMTNAVAQNTQKVSVILTDDVTMPANWTPIDIGFYGDYKNVTNLTINGNGHTISGLTSALVEKVSANCTVTINDLTVKNAHISNSAYTNGLGNGILVGYTENGNVTLNNCHVVDSSVTESRVAAAALIGYVTGVNEINMTNCTVKNTQVAGSDAAGFIGYVQQATVTVSGCTVSRSTFTGSRQAAYFGTVNVGTVANVSNTTADITALVGRQLSTGTVNFN